MLILDVESTGTDRHRDQIVDLSLQIDGNRPVSWRFCPTIPIPPEATAVHGISDADVATSPTFAFAAKQTLSPLPYIRAARVIVGFNLAFDIGMLQAELERAGLPLLDLSEVVLLDAMRLWQSKEPRTLSAAVEKFLGRKHDTAHSAEGDVAATGEVWQAMLEAFGLTDKTQAELAELCDPMPQRASWAGPTDDLVWKDGVVVLNFGKHKGTPLHELDAGMLRWLVENARARHVKDAAKVALMVPGEFVERARRRFGRTT